jgi:quercetin dioxygenase-like cupin family protein
MAVMLSGEMTEFRNSCIDPIVYRAGDVAREDAETAHGWRNTGNGPAVILVSHVVPRS